MSPRIRRSPELKTFEWRLYHLHEIGIAHPERQKRAAVAVRDEKGGREAEDLGVNLAGRNLLETWVPKGILPAVGETVHLEYVKRFLRHNGKLRVPKNGRRWFRGEPSLLAIRRDANGGKIMMKHKNHLGEYKPVFSWRFDDRGVIKEGKAIGTGK